ncbi:hypothetical protein DXG03_001824 [Asterophora parasitica]|uniref:Amino acid permease/ SLC12A domain-containing protein n=1 Tax=Asterophora parasitica TaxID=117018 RepID=A0A9P7KCL6_9AGAR|nr:hypothetical protein DXG03_001824 [Asterophora parasitica]
MSGESEYWLALIKVLMIIVFIFVGLIYDWGGVKNHPGPGLSNFHDGQAFIGGFSAFAQTFVFAFFSFGGIESPLTVVFARAGFGAGVHVINAVLLTAVLSATNSCFFASSRMLLALARAGHAPRVFGWVNRRGVPVPALLMSLAFAALTFLTTIWGEGIVFTWLLNITGISALLVWTSIGLISFRFRYAYKAQGRSLADLPYRQPLYPILPIGVVILGTLMFIAQGYAAVKQEPFEAKNVVATYIGVALYIILYSGYTVYERIQGKTQHFVPTLEIDFDTDAVSIPKAEPESELPDEQDKRQIGRRARAVNWIRDHVY